MIQLSLTAINVPAFGVKTGYYEKTLIQLLLTAINVPAFGVKTEYYEKTLIQLSLTAICVLVFRVVRLTLPVTVFYSLLWSACYNLEPGEIN